MPPDFTNQGYTYRSRAGADAAGCTLVELMARRYSHTSAEHWRARIEAGQVLVDGLACAADASVAPGQWIVWERPPWEEPGVPLSYEVLLEDDDLLAVHKPPGLPTMPAGGFLAHTLLALVRRRRPGASPVHRLGRGTSGVVLFACSDVARSELNAAFREGRVEKRYRALAAGRVPGPLVIETPIGPVPHPVLGAVHAACSDGKPARSRVEVVERREEDTLVDVDIETGRPHQIRIHLAAAGHPLAGDPLYGPGGLPLPGTRALPGDPGYALHAARLAFMHPRTARPVEVRAPVPPPLREG